MGGAARYTWLLFDADGTLFDYDRADAISLAETHEEFELPADPTALARYRAINERLWSLYEDGRMDKLELRAERFRQLFAGLDVAVDCTEFSRRYLDHLGDGGQLIDGAETLLRELREGSHIAIVTNGITEVQRRRLACSAIRKLVEILVISDEVGAAKPHRAFFDEAFRRIGRPENSTVLIIGDSLKADMQGGIQYGIDTCWLNPAGEATELPVTYEIRHLSELSRILQ